MMKKIFLLVLFIGLVASASFAQSAAGKKNGPAALTFKPKSESLVTGLISSLTPSDPAHGIQPGLTLLAEDGNQFTFLIKKTTTIYDIDLKALKPQELRKDSRVKVRYRKDKDGFMEALSISELNQ